MLNQRQITEIEQLIKQVGTFQLQHFGQISSDQAREKALNQLVSEVDVESERQLVNGLRELLPKAGFLTEEGTTDEEERSLRWIIDPLDGTTNYLFGLEHFAISVALLDADELRFGAVYLPRLDRYFMAAGQGAYCNGEALRMSTHTDFLPCLISTGFPYYTFGGMSDYLRLLEYFMRNSKGVRRMGSAATDLAYTAAGHFDLFFEMNLSPWDVAAGSFIIEQAGGRVCGFEGHPDHLFGPSIVGGNPALVERFLTLWKGGETQVTSK